MGLMGQAGMTPNKEGGRRQAAPDTPEDIVAMRVQSVGLAAAAGFIGTDDGARRIIKLKAETDYTLARHERKRKQGGQEGRNW
jgi:hypothetical protein